jgi:ectoine hydroxylase-related dioxygenase (phytanoyl-CoA dioxygenase family)
MGFGKVAELTDSIWDGICDAGDSVWYDYRLMHRGMPNSSASTLRPVVQVIFTKKRYVEKADYNFGKESVFDGNGGVDAAD